MAPSDRVVLGLKESDLPVLLEAVESYYEEVADTCPHQPKCFVCNDKLDALNRIRFALLDNAPRVKVE